MAKRWQYPIKAHVPPAAGASSWKEQTSVDKWEPEYPSMRRTVAAGLTAAILAGSFFFFVPPARSTNDWKETAQLDKWQPTYVNYHYRKPSLPGAIQSGSFFYQSIPASPEVITVDKWLGEGPDVRFQKPGLTPGIQSGSMAAEVPPASGTNDWKERITPDKWLPVYPDRIARLPAAQKADVPFLWVPPSGEIITIDKWLGESPDVRFTKPGLLLAIQSGSFFKSTPWDIASAKETISPDKWIPIYPDRISRRPVAQKVDVPFLWVPPSGEIITIDKWMGEAPDLRFQRYELLRAIQSGSFFIGDIPRKETISLDKWAPSFPAQLFRLPTLSRAIQSGSLFWTYYVFMEALSTYAETLIVQKRDLTLGVTKRDLSLEATARIFSLEVSSKNLSLRTLKRILHLTGIERD